MTMEQIVIGVGGMSCQGCVKNVTSVLRALPGVDSVEVSLEAGHASITYDPAKADAAKFREAIEAAGFDAA
jgi:copper chaperone